MERNGDPPPLLWPQFNAAVPRRGRSPLSPFFSPPVLIMILLSAALLLFLFVVLSFRSVTAQILRPTSVKKSWDSLNVFLVLFAILCGVFARRNDDGSPQRPSSYGEGDMTVANVMVNATDDSKPLSVSLSDVFADDRLKVYQSVSNNTPPTGFLDTGNRRLRRSSTFYPDLCQGGFQEIGGHRFRFHDDFEISKYGSQTVTSEAYSQLPIRRKMNIEESEAKEYSVDISIEPRSSSPQRKPPPSPPPPPPPPPPPLVEIKQTQRTYHSVKIREQRRKARDSAEAASHRIKQAPAAAPPPPPPPPPSKMPAVRVTNESEGKQRSQPRKSNATKEIKLVLASLYNQRKRKRRLQKAKNNSASHENHQSNDFSVIERPYYCSTILPPPPAPPPPPPPPPPRSSQSVFYGLFKKVSKSKKIHSIPAPPPPPPPPSSKRSSKRKIQETKPPKAPPQLPFPPPRVPETPPRRRPGRPPVPTRRVAASYEEDVNSGSQSLYTSIPPPPPLPPFKMPQMKFVFRGDFAKIRSNQSSRSSSPEREEIVLGLGIHESQNVRGSNGGGSAFCPSTDVNVKADSFIARLRDEWRLEKLNSASDKRKMGAA